jgi:hypothetical protein
MKTIEHGSHLREDDTAGIKQKLWISEFLTLDGARAHANVHYVIVGMNPTMSVYWGPMSRDKEEPKVMVSHRPPQLRHS